MQQPRPRTWMPCCTATQTHHSQCKQALCKERMSKTKEGLKRNGCNKRKKTNSVVTTVLWVGPTRFRLLWEFACWVHTTAYLFAFTLVQRGSAPQKTVPTPPPSSSPLLGTVRLEVLPATETYAHYTACQDAVVRVCTRVDWNTVY